MLNEAIIMGRITKDLELRTTNTGNMVTSFTVAVDREYSKDGIKETDFIPVVAWGKTAEFICKYFGKGRMIALTGRIQVRQYTANDGTNRTVTEVVCSKASFTGEKKNDYPVSNTSAGVKNFEIPEGFELIDESEVPF